MSTYQQQPGWAPGPNGGAPLGPAVLHQTAAPHLHPGETLLGAFEISLDPLLPLYSINWEQTRVDLLWAPVRLFVRFLRGFWRGLCTYFLPRWLVEIFMPDLRYRRPYGLRFERRAYRALRRPLHGGSWSGGENSMAWMVWKAVRATPGQQLKADHDYVTLVLTDRRMLLLSRLWLHESKPYQAVGLLELPRGTYGLRRDTPNSVFTRRVDVTFSDGSWIALDMQADADTERDVKALLS